MENYEANTNTYYPCEGEPKPGQRWEVDWDYLGATQNPYYLSNCYLPAEDTEIEGVVEAEEIEIVQVNVTTLNELLYSLSDPAKSILSIEPANDEERVLIETFLAENPSGPLKINFNNREEITATNNLGDTFTDAYVISYADTDCLYDSRNENVFEAQPTGIAEYIENGEYVMGYESQISASYETPNGMKFISRNYNIYMPVSPENTAELAHAASTVYSTEKDSHGVIVGNYILSRVYPFDINGNEQKVVALCTPGIPPLHLIYNQIMKAGGTAMATNRSMSIDESLVRYLNNLMQPHIKPEWFPPVLINSMGNEGQLNDLTYSIDPWKNYIIGVTANDDLNNPKFLQFSNYPFLNELTPYFYTSSYGAFDSAEGGDHVEFIKQGTSMSAPHIYLAYLNYLLSLPKEELVALKVLKPFEVVQKALLESKGVQNHFNTAAIKLNAEQIVPSLYISNSLPSGSIPVGSTMAPTGTIIIDDYATNYSAAYFGYDWRAEEPLTNPNKVITPTIGTLAGIAGLEIRAYIDITDSNGNVKRASFRIANTANTPSSELGQISLPVSIGARYQDLVLSTILKKDIAEERIKPLSRRYSLYLPLITR